MSILLLSLFIFKFFLWNNKIDSRNLVDDISIMIFDWQICVEHFFENFKFSNSFNFMLMLLSSSRSFKYPKNVICKLRYFGSTWLSKWEKQWHDVSFFVTFTSVKTNAFCRWWLWKYSLSIGRPKVDIIKKFLKENLGNIFKQNRNVICHHFFIFQEGL